MLSNSKQKPSIFSRRTFNTLLGSLGITAVSSTKSLPSFNLARGKVAVIGGGFGGTTAARFLKSFDHSLEVILIEPNKNYITCPFSNTVISGINKYNYIIKNYSYIEKLGVKIIHDLAIEIDTIQKLIILSNGKTIAYDRCIVSPGIDFKYDAIKGNSPKTSEKLPHAWKAGVQTQLLREQLLEMPDGGIFLISPPNNPFRCPPGPAERISLVADYFTKHKPKSKIIVLDPKKKFGKQSLFKEGWEQLYPNMIEYRNIDEFGTVREVDSDKMLLATDIDEVKANVINLIPAQKAGQIAFNSGLTDESGWCPINQRTFESTHQKDIYIIGDASISSPMPKSGVSAFSQAQTCAAAIISSLREEPLRVPKLINYCYSLVAPDYGVSIVMVYEYDGQKLKKVIGSSGNSPSNRSLAFRKREALYAKEWYETITQKIWGQ